MNRKKQKNKQEFYLIALLEKATHQHLVYADDVNVLGGSVRTVKKNAEASVFASKEIGLEVTADKTKYMVMSRDQTAGEVTV